MTRFGTSIPSAIPQPAVAPQTIASSGLAAALGIVGTTIQADRAQIRRNMENARVGTALEIEADEVERARTRLDASTLRLESLETQLDTDEQRRFARQIVDQEEFGLQAVLGSMEPTEAAQYLADHPAVDPVNSEKYARWLGDQLAASSLTEVQQQIVGASDPSTVSIAGLVDAAMRKSRIGELHPSAAMSFKGNLLGQAAQIRRGAIMRTASERQRQAEEGAAASSMGIIMLGAADGMWGVEAIDAMRSNAVLRGVPDTDTAFAQQAFGPDVVRAWGETKSRMGDDPAAIQRFSKWVEGTISAAPTEHLQRAMRDAVKATGVIEESHRMVKQQEAVRYNQTRSLVKSQIDSKVDVGDLTGLEALKDQASQHGLADQWNKARLTTDTSVTDAYAILDYLGGSAEAMPEKYTRQALEFAWKNASGGGLAPFMLATGDVPDSVVKDIDGHMTAGRFGDAFAIYREIDGVMPERASQIAGSTAGGDRLRLAARMLRGVDVQRPGFQAVFGVFADPQAEEWFSQAKIPFTPGRSKASTEAIPDIVAANEIQSMLQTPAVSAQASRDFQDAYSFRFAQASQRGEVDPETVLAQAQDDFKRTHVSVSGAAVPTDVFGIGNSLDPDWRAQSAIESAIGNFRAREEGSTGEGIVSSVLRPKFANVFFPLDAVGGEGGKVLVERATSFNGKAYIPAAVEEDGMPVAKRFLEWDPASQEVRYLNAEAPGDDAETIKSLQGIFDGKINPQELSPTWMIRWRPEYGTRDLKAFDGESGGQFAKQVKAVALHTYARMYGSPPTQAEIDSEIPSVRREADRKAKILDRLAVFLAERAGWDVDAGGTVEKKPSSAGGDE